MDTDKIKPGTTVHCVICKGCGMVVPFSPKQKLEEMPQTFHAICPKCGHDGEYQKSEIKSALVFR